MGFSPELAKLFRDAPQVDIKPITAASRVACLSRIVETIRFASSSRSLRSTCYPSYLSLLTLLSLDEGASGDFLRLCCATLWKLLSDFDSPDLPIQYLNIIGPWLLRQPLGVQTRCVAVLGGASSTSSNIIVRWMSWSVLTGAEWKKKSLTTHPPVGYLLNLFTHHNPEKATFSIHPKTDYTALAMRTEILGHLLTDIDGFCTLPKAERSEGSDDTSDISLLVHALNDLHPKIRDIPSARLERTRARDALQRLSMQLHYQIDAVRTKQRKVTLNRWLSKSS